MDTSTPLPAVDPPATARRPLRAFAVWGLVIGLGLGSVAAQAGGVFVSVNVDLPGAVLRAVGPSYVVRQPVHAYPPAYHQPVQVYHPAPVYGHPAPVYMPPAVVYHPPRVVYAPPAYGHGSHHHHHHHQYRHHRRDWDGHGRGGWEGRWEGRGDGRHGHAEAPMMVPRGGDHRDGGRRVVPHEGFDQGGRSDGDAHFERRR